MTDGFVPAPVGTMDAGSEGFSARFGTARKAVVQTAGVGADPAMDQATCPVNDEVIGCSAAIQKIVEQVSLFSPSSAPVLVTGESGTGKEVIARLIHNWSAQASRRYVRVNCAALSETLIESELFGHERGAFTGASEERVGRFEWAGKGTLLLDEISEIPPSLQAKLLRVLEEEEFQRVGSNRSLPMEARIIATSNRDPLDEVAAGRFREDLYYRLNVLQIHIPPLRERREDIPLLVEYFVRQFGQEGYAGVSAVHPAAMQQLCNYTWPGNVRQLRNIVRRLCILSRAAVIRADDLPELVARPQPESTSVDFYQMTLRDVERRLIKASLRRFSGNRTAAAQHLGVTPRTLFNRLRQDPELLRAD
jgi:two-component system response regulator HydG/two-component system response regulator AtoC